LTYLSCSKQSIAGIAEARDDVAAIVESVVDGGGHDADIGMGFGERGDAFGAAYSKTYQST
jgi:hypothetical protein